MTGDRPLWRGLGPGGRGPRERGVRGLRLRRRWEGKEDQGPPTSKMQQQLLTRMCQEKAPPPTWTKGRLEKPNRGERTEKP